jgi:hypothetical protein
MSEGFVEWYEDNGKRAGRVIAELCLAGVISGTLSYFTGLTPYLAFPVTVAAMSGESIWEAIKLFAPNKDKAHDSDWRQARRLAQIQTADTKAVIGEANSLGLSMPKCVVRGSHPTVLPFSLRIGRSPRAIEVRVDRWLLPAVLFAQRAGRLRLFYRCYFRRSVVLLGSRAVASSRDQ